MRRSARSGNAVVMFVMAFAVLAGFAAFAVDFGMLRVERVQLQQSADAAVLAAAQRLNGTEDGIIAAQTLASEVAAANLVRGGALDLSGSGVTSGTIEFGSWQDGAFVTSDTLTMTNAVRVRANSQMPTIFARLAFSVSELGSTIETIAVGGGPGSAECSLPLAVPAEVFEDAACGTLNITFNPDKRDTGAWALLGYSNPNSNDVRNAISSCTLDASITDVVSLNNGTMSSAGKELADTLIASTARWNSAWGTQPTRMSTSALSASQYGRVLVRPIIVVDMPATTTMNGNGEPIAGFAKVAVYDITGSGQRTISMHVLCDDSDTLGGGGAFHSTSRPFLAQ